MLKTLLKNIMTATDVEVAWGHYGMLLLQINLEMAKRGLQLAVGLPCNTHQRQREIVSYPWKDPQDFF